MVRIVKRVQSIVELFTHSKKSTDISFVFSWKVKRVFTTLLEQSSVILSIIIATGFWLKKSLSKEKYLSKTLGKYI